MRKRKVAVVTGTRAEFGIWRSVLEGIAASKKLELQLVVTGMHLQKEFGETVKEVEESGFEIARRVVMYRKGEAAGESLVRGVAGLGRAFRELESDVVMVLGDRLEMLAAASAAVAERRVIGHVHGGERAPGTWDEQIRHAITKMAHVHFCATAAAGKRILQMGEEKGSVHVVGAPGLDGIGKDERRKTKDDRGAGPWPGGRAPILVVLHPSSADDEVEAGRARMVLEAMGAGRGFCVIGPNNDRGHEGILRGYREMSTPVTMSVKREDFWNMMRQSSVMVGNSSAGILEAASFGCPVVNIGERQKGRERSGNVIDVGWNVGEIRAGIERAVSDKAFLRRVALRKNVYGDGGAGGRIVKVLEGMGEVSVTKGFVDR